MFKYLIAAGLICFYFGGYAQLVWHVAPGAPTDFSTDSYFRAAARITDSTEVVALLSAGLSKLRNDFFLEASVDSFFQKEAQWHVFLHTGPVYEWVALKTDSSVALFLDETGFKKRWFENESFDWARWQRLQTQLVSYAENHGFPFAEAKLSSIQVAEGQVKAQLNFIKGPLIWVKSIQTEGDSRVSDGYLRRYLGIAPGDVYNQGQVLRIRNRLRELPFVALAQDPLVQFVGDQASIRLLLNKKKASRFDFIIGVLPRSSSIAQEGERRLLITGTFDGELQNQFGWGERIYVSFEQLRPETQELEADFQYPYILGLPFGSDLHFGLYKRDTSFIDLQYDIGLQYLLEAGNYLKAFWNTRNSTLLTVNEALLMQQNRLPDNLDILYRGFGLEYAFQRLDYRVNPRKGWSVLLNGTAGIKRIERNNRIVELGYESLYDTLQARSFQYQIQAELARYFPLFSSSTLKIGARTGMLLSENSIYQNEQYRIGGNKLLRGFDEESIFATQFVVATLEYRLLISSNSYLYTFGDFAYLEDETNIKNKTDRPLGFGAGITFETKAGLFGVSLAYGKQLDNPIDFSSPKVHFGYVSLF
ncbi:MAG TPA: BamA/TamA family outer membrane protein [Saprospiraceae bacterium]|nr:BamA/TamA family outer membrane protein [Saprospiraceae bacterium]HMQ82891.1 BamA/TamA family outer membrane protein [Saprospiraceae bacterium]